MRQATSLLLPVVIGTLLFNFLFWHESLGLNSLIFALFFVGTLYYLYPDCRQSKSFWATAAAAILTAIMIVWHNSAAAKFAHILSIICASGFAQEPGMRQILRAFLQYFVGFFQTPKHFFESLSAGSPNREKKGRSFGKAIGLSIIPLVVVTVFYLLYYAANDKFAALADQFWAQVGRILTFDISWSHLMFVLFAFIFTGAAFWRNQSSFAAEDLADKDQLLRVRLPRKRFIASHQMFGLKREYQQSAILLWMLNGLVLLVNLVDIRYVWFGLDEEAVRDLKGYVHEGTYYLITSILLAMGVLFYVFRKNINFMPNNKMLKTAASIWLAQNAILAISVAVRTSRYIEFHGLAYKRIGVFLFLLLVFFGLFTLYQKIKDRKSMSWIWLQNGWALFFIIILNACISWDTFITNYNLSGAPKGAVDVNYMINQVSDKNINILEANIGALQGMNMYPQLTEEKIANDINRKRHRFDKRMSKLSWLSWNSIDAANAKQPAD